MVEPDARQVFEVKAVVPDETNSDDGHGLQDEDVLKDLQVDPEQVIEEEGGQAHHGYSYAYRGKLPGGQAEYDLFAVVVDLLGDACF